MMAMVASLMVMMKAIPQQQVGAWMARRWGGIMYGPALEVQGPPLQVYSPAVEVQGPTE